MNKINDILDSDGFYFSPMGGSEEFGVNFNLYVCDGEYLIIDCGIGFADDRHPGIDLLLPDPSFIEKNRDKIAGIIITHAHEDHIGAVAYLWERMGCCPIYATPFTARVLDKKLEQEGVFDASVNIIEQNNSFDIGSNFSAEFVPVSHSIPDASSMIIKTKYGSIIHSGDWNLDQEPIIGTKTSAERFKSIGDDGVLAYIGDSTNSQVNGYAGSESDVAKGLMSEFSNHKKGKIFVTMFASNIGRIISIARAAAAVDRSVALVGRSLHRMVGIAMECGYMDGLPDFLEESDIEHISDDNLLIIVTGSQGEHRAALARIARGDHRRVSLNRGDTVIFSSRAIPGNERTISVVKNNLSAAGINMVTPRDTQNLIHVSGHPCKAEVETMLEWLRPTCVIPVHGERQQLDAQGRIANDLNVDHVIVPSNGSVIRLAPNAPKLVGEIETGLLAVDQRRIIPATHQSITARRKLQYSGAVHASLVLDSNLNILGSIKIDTVGLSCKKSDDCIIQELEDYILDALDSLDIGLSEDEIAEQIRISLRKYVLEILGLRPKTTMHVTLVDI